MRDRSLQSDDRAVSIALTHVLTVGITTILITGLLIGGSGLLEDTKSDATRSELRTIGNRMASEISSAYYSANGSDDATMTMRVSHPRLVAGNSYNVELRENCEGIPGYDSSPYPDCLVMQPPSMQNEVKIPLDPEISLKDPPTRVQGGDAYIVVEDTGSGLEVTIQSSPPKLAPMPEVRR